MHKSSFPSTFVINRMLASLYALTMLPARLALTLMPPIKFINFSADGLLAITEDLERATIQLRAAHDMMEKLGLSEIEISRATEALKGVKAVNAFSNAALEAITEHRLGDSKLQKRERKK